MRFRNDGSGESNVVQNRFTAYLLQAIHRKKIDVMKKRHRLAAYESSVDFQEYGEWRSVSGTGDLYPSLETCIEHIALEQAIMHLSARERYVVLSRALQEKGFQALGDELGLSYSGTAAVYYRALHKIKKELEEDHI